MKIQCRRQNILRPLCKVPDPSARLQPNLNFLDRFLYKSRVSNLTEIRPVESDLVSKEQTEGHFPRLCEKRLKKEEHGNRPAAFAVRAKPACPRLRIKQLHSGIVCYTLGTLE
jgi:hypothetical protein